MIGNWTSSFAPHLERGEGGVIRKKGEVKDNSRISHKRQLKGGIRGIKLDEENGCQHRD